MKKMLKPNKVSIFILLSALFLCRLASAQEPAMWQQYVATFISPDGRVIDYSQNQNSHSEGQGYGMLLAAAYNDRDTFERLWLWTKKNLGVRDDSLMAWQWGMRQNRQWEAVDYNNATDGDVLIAYGLLKGWEKWSNEGYKTEAVKIIISLREKLAVDWQGHTFLLPGYYGFTKDGVIVLNTSYMIFPAYRKFAEVDKKQFWEKVYKDSLDMAGRACFGNPCFPSDWIMADGKGVSIYKERQPRYGYEAVRMVLYLLWDRQRLPAGVQTLLNLYNQFGYIPLWIDLEAEGISLKPSSAGFYAIYGLAAEKTGNLEAGRKLKEEARKKLMTEKNDYYSFSLYMLTTIEGGL